MIYFIKYGIERTPIDVGEYMVKCPCCETDQWAELMISSTYSHVFCVPIIPIDKDALVICKKCGLKRSGVPFDARLISNYHEIKEMYRHRWFTYIGAAILALPFVIWIILLLIRYVR